MAIYYKGIIYICVDSSETLYFDIIDDNINSSDKINGVSQFLTKNISMFTFKKLQEKF